MADIRQIATEAVEAFNARDEARMRELYAADAVFEAPGDVRLEGAEATTDYAMVWLRAFPDARVTVRNELIAGDWIVQQFTFEGTHQDTLVGPAGEIPATNRRLVGRGVQIFRVAERKIDGRVLYGLGDFLDDYAVDPLLRNDLGLLFLVTLDCEGPRRLEALPLKLDYCYRGSPTARTPPGSAGASRQRARPSERRLARSKGGL